MGPHAAGRSTAVLWAVTMLVVTYGSLYPLKFAAPVDLGHTWHHMVFEAGWWEGTGDVVANVLLFLPLGALSWLLLARWPAAAWRRLAVLLAAGFLFGFALQVAQLWLPRRSPQLSDAVWNTLGLLVGVALATPLGTALAHLARRPRSAQRAGLALGALWLAAAWWPLLPALSRRELRWGWQELQQGLHAAPAQVLVAALATAAVLHLLRQAAWRAAAALALPALATGGALVFAMQPGGSVQPLAWLLGAVLGALSWLLPARAADALLVPVALGALVLQAAWPWSWSWPLAASAWSWVPLEHALGGADRAPRTLALLWQLFWCAAAMLAARRLGLRAAPAAALLAALLLGLELLQRFMPGHQAELTPVLLPVLCLLVLRAAGPRH